MTEQEIQAAADDFREKLRTAGPPDWLVRMHRDYAETGTVQAEDLRRLIGDPNRRVESSPEAALSAFVAK